MNIRTQTAVFAEVVAGVEAGRRISTCPEWLMRDLVGHIGQAPRWAAGVVRSGVASPPPDPRDAEPGPPEAWTDWLLAGADELLDAVASVDAGTEVWTLVGPRPASWWVRRLRSDLVVHTADAALTSGVPYQVPDELAADTISEGLDLLATPGLAKFPGSREGTIALRPSTGDGWLFTRADGYAWQRGAGPADVTLSGSTSDLLLVLMRRVPLDQVKVDGDRMLMEELLTYSV
jgi:uncharacterized protein (TIGR03083 family)